MIEGDDGVREHHGTMAVKGSIFQGSVRIWEDGYTVTIRVFDGQSGTEQHLSPPAAHYFASKLHRLANRAARRQADYELERWRNEKAAKEKAERQANNKDKGKAVA